MKRVVGQPDRYSFNPLCTFGAQPPFLLNVALSTSGARTPAQRVVVLRNPPGFSCSAPNETSHFAASRFSCGTVSPSVSVNSRETAKTDVPEIRLPLWERNGPRGCGEPM